MTAEPDGASVPHNARVWNYWLGGNDHHPVDRAAGDQVAAMFPGIVDVARANRAFLRRAVAYLAGQAGVGQFLDIGAGLPAPGSTHEVARQAAPQTRVRVVYIDNDPMVTAHARALLTPAPGVATDYIEADLREPEAILRGAARTLDFSRPVGVLLLGVVNFIPGTDDARAIVQSLVSALPPGSYLALTHPTLELGGEANAAAMRFWNANATPPITARSGQEIAGFFAGLEMLEPGLVPCSRWRPEVSATGTSGAGPPPEVPQFGAVGRKNQ